MLLDNLDESGVVEVREVTCANAVSSCESSAPERHRTEIVHVGNDVRKVLLQIDELILRLVIRDIAHAIIKVLPLSLPGRNSRRSVGDEDLDLILVRRDLVRELGNLPILFVSPRRIKLARGRKPHLSFLELDDLVELALERANKVCFVRVVPLVIILAVLDESLQSRVCARGQREERNAETRRDGQSM